MLQYIENDVCLAVYDMQRSLTSIVGAGVLEERNYTQNGYFQLQHIWSRWKKTNGYTRCDFSESDKFYRTTKYEVQLHIKRITLKFYPFNGDSVFGLSMCSSVRDHIILSLC